MKSNYPRSDRAQKRGSPSIVWASLLAAVTGYILLSSVSRRLGAGSSISDELWPYALSLGGVLAGLGVVMTVVTLWRARSWPIQQKAMFAVLSALLFLAISISQAFMTGMRLSNMSFSPLFFARIAVFVFAYALVGIVVWGVANIFYKLKHVKSTGEILESVERITPSMDLGNVTTTTDQEPHQHIRHQ